jgi:MFS family permease
MIEIIVLINLAKKIGAIVEEKGRNKGRYQLMLVLFWFGGEIFGGLIGAILAEIALENEGSGQLLAYLFAIICAVLGAVTAFLIAKNLEPISVPEPVFDTREAVLDRWSDRFNPNATAPREQIEGYTGSEEQAKRPLDERIQD